MVIVLRLILGEMMECVPSLVFLIRDFFGMWFS